MGLSVALHFSPLRYMQPTTRRHILISFPRSKRPMDSPARKKNRTGTISTEDDDEPCRMGGDLKDAESFCIDEASIPTRPIPAPVWGHALDYMPYNEVRSALLICKTIANEAVQHVQTVCFTKACQLDAKALRRFPNITQVKCLCLLHGNFYSMTICEDTVFRIVPLLTALPKLECFFIGGKYIGRLLTTFIPEVADASFNRNLALMKALFHSVLGGFKGRMFASTVKRTNVCQLLYYFFYDPHHGLGICTDRDNDNLCKVCKDICSYFPLQDAIWRCCMKVGCMKEREAVVNSLEIIGKREGAKNIFQRQRICELLFLPVLQDLRSFNYDKHPEEGNLLRRNLSKVACARKSLSGVPLVFFIPPPTLEYLDRLISLGITPSAIPRWKNEHVDSRVIIKSTFDALVRRGFALDEDDFIVLDETVEPALQCVLGQMYSCMI